MRKILSIVLMSAMIISLVLPVIAAPAQGSDFTFDTTTGTITSYNGTGGNVEIPDEIGGVTVEAIGSEAFHSCTSLTKVTIPTSVTTIEQGAFVACKNLTTAYFKHSDANTITSFASDAFLSTAPNFKIIYPKDAVNFTTPVWNGYAAYPELPELNVTVDKNTVKAGENFNVDVAFKEIVNGNAAILTYKYDPTKFEYENFYSLIGVDSLFIDDSESGILKITVMVREYDMKDFGNAVFSAKKDVKLTDEQNKINVEIECVIKENDVKSVAYSKGATPSWVTPTKYTLMDLSNIIDMFGSDNTMEKWETEYKFYDFDDNGKIDIRDIVNVAQLIRNP